MKGLYDDCDTVRLIFVYAIMAMLAKNSCGSWLDRRCQVPPAFTINGFDPMSDARGKVTVVALLTNNCNFCLIQAANMEFLHRMFEMRGQAVKMLIVDGGPQNEIQEANLANRISFDIYKDNSNGVLWRRVFEGQKDDIIIFDRCGQLTYHISYQLSDLRYNIVELAINQTLNAENHICPCSQ